MSVRARLYDLGIELLPVPPPAAAYAPAVVAGHHLFTAGHLPLVDGTLAQTGRCGAEIDLERARRLARTAALNMLSAPCSIVNGDVDRLRLLKLTVFVASDSEFTDQHLVANGASLLLHEVLGDRGVHARSAVGVAALPLDAPVEVEGTFTVDPRDRTKLNPTEERSVVRPGAGSASYG